METYYFWLVFCVIIASIVLIDANVADAIVLTFRWLNIKWMRLKWWVVDNPEQPWANYLIWRRAMKIAKELQNEIEMGRGPDTPNDNSKTSE